MGGAGRDHHLAVAVGADHPRIGGGVEGLVLASGHQQERGMDAAQRHAVILGRIGLHALQRGEAVGGPTGLVQLQDRQLVQGVHRDQVEQQHAEQTGCVEDGELGAGA